MLSSVQPKPYPTKRILVGLSFSLALGALTWELINLANQAIHLKQINEQEASRIEVLNQSDQLIPAWVAWKSDRTDRMQP